MSLLEKTLEHGCKKYEWFHELKKILNDIKFYQHMVYKKIIVH